MAEAIIKPYIRTIFLSRNSFAVDFTYLKENSSLSSLGSMSIGISRVGMNMNIGRDNKETPAIKKNNTLSVENSNKNPFTKLDSIWLDNIIVQKMLVYKPFFSGHILAQSFKHLLCATHRTLDATPHTADAMITSEYIISFYTVCSTCIVWFPSYVFTWLLLNTVVNESDSTHMLRPSPDRINAFLCWSLLTMEAAVRLDKE